MNSQTLPFPTPQVIAASALVLSQAQELLQVAEPAWQFDAYSKIWTVMATDYALEGRLHTLEVKVCEKV